MHLRAVVLPAYPPIPVAVTSTNHVIYWHVDVPLGTVCWVIIRHRFVQRGLFMPLESVRSPPFQNAIQRDCRCDKEEHRGNPARSVHTLTTDQPKRPQQEETAQGTQVAEKTEESLHVCLHVAVGKWEQPQPNEALRLRVHVLEVLPRLIRIVDHLL